MATSLARQLQLHATPQAANLLESKSVPSILYDSKKAAETDLQTIFDQGKSGLEELINMNSAFRQFQNTLFDDSTIGFQRSVQSAEVNDNLTKNIKKLLYHLSPHFLVHAAHKCLEWLIRRYRINDFDVDDMMALILPYHETMMFVKCLQTIKLEKGSKWYWLKVIQKPGVPLSKQALFNRAANNAEFLQFIAKTTSDAVKELNARAHSLQALFAFYSTVTVGALDVANEINDSHVLSINKALLKGLSSEVADYRGASMIIAAFMMTKINFTETFLQIIIAKTASNISRQELRRESINFLTIIFRTQNDGPEAEAQLADMFWKQTIDNSLIVPALVSLYNDNVDIWSLCLPLITKCLGRADDKIQAKRCREFVDMLLEKLTLTSHDANAIIRCILNALKPKQKPASQNEIIDLSDEDDDDVGMVDGKIEENRWHSSLMRSLDTKYPEVFDAVKTDIMSSQDEESSALKIVLGALLCNSYNNDPSSAAIFVDLYHPSAQNRMQAVEDLVNKLSTMPLSDDRKNLLVAGITQRLSDDSPDVVGKVLKCETEHLIKIVGEQNLIKKLKYIIGDEFMTRKKWQNPIGLAIKHITSKHLLTDDNECEIFLAIWPYMFPLNDICSHHTKAIAKSSIGNRFPIIDKLQDFKYSKGNNKKQLDGINKRLENSLGKSRVDEIVQFVNTIPDVDMTRMSAFHIINLLTQVLPKNSDQTLSAQVFDIATKLTSQFGMAAVDMDKYAKNLYGKNEPEKLPIQLLVSCIEAIIEKTNFTAVTSSDGIDFTIRTEELNLILNIYEHFCIGLFSKNEKKSSLYNQLMSRFVRIVLPSTEKQFAFFSNFFIVHYIDQLQLPESVRLTPVLQLRSMQIFNALMKQMKSADLQEIKMEVFIRIISGLTSPLEAIRVLTCETIKELHELLDPSSEYGKMFEFILSKRGDVTMNSERLPLILYNIKREHSKIFERAQQLLQRPDCAMVLKATMLNIFKLVDDPKYLKLVVDLALDILQRIDYSQPTVLNPHESIVVYQAIIHFNQKTISSISVAGSRRTFFEMMLQRSNISITIDQAVASISVKAMNLNVFNDFKDFKKDQQKFIIDSVVKCATFAKCNEVRKRAGKFFQKSIDLDGNMELDVLTKMVKIATVDVSEKEQVKYLSQELLQTTEWKCGVTLLELLQKKQLKNQLGLIRQMFPVLQKCLQFDDQSMVEYTKQLLLNDISNCCHSMTGPFKESDFQFDLVVRCVRGTQNPQTHHCALKLLSKLAAMIPDSVLQHIMEIFTFVGNAVVKRDDDYIYQLISDVIKSVVPILKRNNVLHVLREFSVILLDVPVHRRSALYEELLKTLGAQEYLGVFLAYLFEKDVREEDDRKLDAHKNMKTVIAIEITNLFDCNVILQTCDWLIKFVRAQLSAIDQRTEISADLRSVFNPKLYDRKHIVRYFYLILNFVNVLTKDRSEFATKMSSLEQSSLLIHKKTFNAIIPTILTHIKESSQSRLVSSDINWSDGFKACYHILDNLLALLYPDMLLQVVNALLSESNAVEVRQQIIDLLNKKLHSPELFADHKKSIFSLLAPITKIVSSISETPTITKLQQHALVSVHLLSAIVARDHPTEFEHVLYTLSKILQTEKELSISLRALVVQCLGELCGNLRVNALPHLHRVMPAIQNLLDDLLSKQIDVVSVVYDIILKSICRIVETVPKFLSPYLVNLIASLSVLWSRLQTTPSNESRKILLKLDEIWQKLAASLELRVLIPMVEKHIYPELLRKQKFDAIGPLMELLLDSFGHPEQANLSQNHAELTTFFIGVMDFRSKCHGRCTTVDVQEDCIIKTLNEYVLKLSEASFRPFYSKLMEWSNENGGVSYDRAITFYRLSNKIAESLKSLFIAFATPIIQHSADLLSKTFTAAEKQASSAPPATLVYNILSTLQTVFLHSNSFINSQRFNVLVAPLVNVLEYEEYAKDTNISEILPKCLAQFAVAANNDLLWKQLNHQILMKTRRTSVVTRRWALTCSVEVLIQLGEDSTQLYPEIIPFFSELMEDEDTEIIKICNRSITEIEKVTGEDLQKHL